MIYKMKFFKKESSERVVNIVSMSLTDMQVAGNCDSCNKELPINTRVVGKTIMLENMTVSRSVFSPSCLQCSDMS